MNYRIAVGSYTRREGHVPDARGAGISIIGIAFQNESAAVLQTIPELTNPSYLAAEKEYLYCVSETPTGVGSSSAWRQVKQRFTQVPASADSPILAGCHLIPIPKRNLIATASYSEGSMSLFALKDGLIGADILNCTYSGSGPNRQRQEAAHAHQVVAGPEGKYLFVTDLGSDTVWVHDLDDPGSPPHVALKTPAGFGPRHMVFDRETATAFILCELIPKLLTADLNPENGSLEPRQELDSTTESGMSRSAPAAVKLHPTGRTLAVSNRFDDTISVFEIDRSEGLGLRLVENFPCRGKTPRDINFTDDGGILFIANQDSHDIQNRFFDERTGLPIDRWGPKIEIGSPACVINI